MKPSSSPYRTAILAHRSTLADASRSPWWVSPFRKHRAFKRRYDPVRRECFRLIRRLRERGLENLTPVRDLFVLMCASSATTLEEFLGMMKILKRTGETAYDAAGSSASFSFRPSPSPLNSYREL